MSIISDFVLDTALNVIINDSTRLHIVPSIPSSYADVIATTLGNTTSLNFSAPVTEGNVRKTTTAVITGGNITKNGTATHYAFVDETNERLLAVGSMGSEQEVVSGNLFSLGTVDIGLKPSI